MLIVVSDSGFVKDEAAVVNALFSEGLDVFHLRKPSASAPALEGLLAQINAQHRGKLALHSHHRLANAFGLCRLHYTAEKRRSSTGPEWQAVKEGGHHLSTSVHNLEEAKELPDCFAYAFFGPVFDSISKKGYRATLKENTRLPASMPTLVAIGGIDESNCGKALRMGFNGIAVLGAVWQSANPVKRFQQIQKAWSSIAPLS